MSMHREDWRALGERVKQYVMTHGVAMVGAFAAGYAAARFVGLFA